MQWPPVTGLWQRVAAARRGNGHRLSGAATEDPLRAGFGLTIGRSHAGPYPGGTSIATATVTHTHVYQSAFPGLATRLSVVWTTNVRVDAATNNTSVFNVACTREDGSTVTNIEAAGGSSATLRPMTPAIFTSR